MSSRLEAYLQAMSGPDYAMVFFMLVALVVIPGYFAYSAFRRYRFIEGTATSKIRSAAQGHVELKGLGEWMPDDSIRSPFSNRPCVWYHCTIDKKSRSGKRSSWTNITDQLSGHLFHLVDETGVCIIDPDDAHVIPGSEMTWYGQSADAHNQTPKKTSWFRIGFGNYRFRERLLMTASPLYALGWFSTARHDPSEEFISKRVNDLVQGWKLQPARYLGDYDLDDNGKIQKSEWEIIRGVARKQVLAEISREKNEHHVLSKPENRRQPFILSATEEEQMVSAKKRKAHLLTALAFLSLTALIVMFFIRSPFPV